MRNLSFTHYALSRIKWIARRTWLPRVNKSNLEHDFISSVFLIRRERAKIGLPILPCWVSMDMAEVEYQFYLVSRSVSMEIVSSASTAWVTKHHGQINVTAPNHPLKMDTGVKTLAAIKGGYRKFNFVITYKMKTRVGEFLFINWCQAT